jgi:hypothetical protein
MHRVAAKFVPRILTADQKQQQQFLAKKKAGIPGETKWLPSPTHRTPLIWHPVISSYFQKLN